MSTKKSTPSPALTPTLEQLHQELQSLKQLVETHANLITQLQETLARKRRPVASNGKVQIWDKQIGTIYPNKNDAYRVLKAGGRIMVSDIVLFKAIPDAILNSIEMYGICITNASLKADYLRTIIAVGIKEVKVPSDSAFPVEYMISDITVQAIRDDLGISPEQAEAYATS